MSSKTSKNLSTTNNNCKKCDNESVNLKKRDQGLTVEQLSVLKQPVSSTINDDAPFDSCSWKTDSATTDSTKICNINNTTVETDQSIEITSGNCRQKMFFKYGKEFVCILALALTTYAAFQNGPPKIARTPAPKPFFPKNSIVQEWPGGHLNAVQTKVSTSELSLVLFYAPWSAESQYARDAYDSVSKLFYKEAYFAAVNCWRPAGECRLQYSKVQSWPVLMAYYHQGIAVQYHGLWNTHSLSRFVMNLLNPVKRITTTDDLLKMCIDHDAVVVGHFNNTHLASKYQIFFQTAIKWLEIDFFQNIQFAVVTGSTIAEFDVPDTPLIRMYLWNETLELSSDNLTSNKIIDWIRDHVNSVSSWVHLPGRKSSTLATDLNRGPALIFFSPRDYYYPNKDAYHLLKQVALDYFNCQNDVWVHEVVTSYIVSQRKENRKIFENFITKCAEENILELKKMKRETEGCFNDKSHVSFATILNNSKYLEIIKEDSEFCFNRRNTQNFAKDINCKRDTLFERVNKNKKTAYFMESNYDSKSSSNLYKQSINRICKNILLSKETSGNIYFEKEPSALKNESKLTGMGCRFNRTLSFLLLDSLSYNVLAKQLGVNVLKTPKKSTIFIVDSINDSTFEMKNEISTPSVAAFVESFHAGTIGRTLKINKINSKENQVNDKKFFIREINSQQFNDYIETTNKTAIVLFYSTQCALCNLLSQTLLIVAKVLEYLQIDFFRIDGERNDFLWEYTMDTYPTLIIFPNKRSETRIFPRSLDVNIPNVLGFVSANLNPIDRIHAIFESCRIAKSSSNFQNCVESLRKEINKNISENLRFWRQYPQVRSKILKRLQILKQISLITFKMNQSCDLEKFRKLIIPFLKKIESHSIAKYLR